MEGFEAGVALFFIAGVLFAGIAWLVPGHERHRHGQIIDHDEVQVFE